MIHKHHFYYLLVFLAGVISCNAEHVEVIPSHAEDLENLIVYSLDETPMLDIRLIREQAFGDVDDGYISRLADVAVDERGWVYIADGEQLNIKAFDPDGNFTTLFGR